RAPRAGGIDQLADRSRRASQMATSASARAAHEFGGGGDGTRSPSAPAITVISPTIAPWSSLTSRRGIDSSHSIVKYGSTDLSALGRLSQIWNNSTGFG